MSTFALPAVPPTPRLPADVGADLLEYVDFKWLMAGQGHRIDLDRLRADRDYAGGCVALARGSSSATLRAAGARLARAIGRWAVA